MLFEVDINNLFKLSFINKEFFLADKYYLLEQNSLVNKKAFGLYLKNLMGKFVISCYYNNFYDWCFEFKLRGC
jgi:hypothetical protein